MIIFVRILQTPVQRNFFYSLRKTTSKPSKTNIKVHYIQRLIAYLTENTVCYPWNTGREKMSIYINSRLQNSEVLVLKLAVGIVATKL